MLVSNLYVVESADFTWLSARTGLTDGNISSHMSRLEEAGYVTVHKAFEGKKPRTTYTLSSMGREAFDDYRSTIGVILGPAEA